MKPITVIRKEHFNAAHRLHNPKWDDKTNKEVFGKCNNPNFHGHNYDLEVMVSGMLNQETGYLMDMKILSSIIKNQVINYMDHKNLNLDVDEFKTLNPISEFRKNLKPLSQYSLKQISTTFNWVFQTLEQIIRAVIRF